MSRARSVPLIAAAKIARCMKLDLRQVDAFVVDCPYDPGEVVLRRGEPYSDALRGRARRLAEPPQKVRQPAALLGVLGDRLHARALDLGLQRRGRALGDD